MSISDDDINEQPADDGLPPQGGRRLRRHRQRRFGRDRRRRFGRHRRRRLGRHRRRRSDGRPTAPTAATRTAPTPERGRALAGQARPASGRPGPRRARRRCRRRSVARSCSVGRWRRECRRSSGSATSRCCGTTCCAAARASRRSASCAPAPRWPRATSPVGRASGTTTSTTWCPPTRSSTATARGDTVVLQGLHHTNPHLARLANNLALALDHPVQVNAYLSPSSARGLDLHFDYHDVFVVQLGGSKRWRIWAPLARTTNPVKGRAFDRRAAVRRARRSAARHHDVRRRLPVPATGLSARGRDGGSALGPPDDRLGGGDVAAGSAQGDRRRGRGGPADGCVARRAARTWSRSAHRRPSVWRACGQRVAPETLRHWMAREIWRRQPATRLRPRVAPSLQSRRLAFTPGPLDLADDGRRPSRARARRSTPRHARRSARLPRPRCSTPSARSNPTRLKGLDDESRAVVLRRLLAEGVLAHVD